MGGMEDAFSSKAMVERDIRQNPELGVHSASSDGYRLLAVPVVQRVVTRFVAGNWAINDLDWVGKIKHVHDDGTLDIILYSREGDRVGRKSLALDGPTGFEPCCSPEFWLKIHEPRFPLSRRHYLRELLEFV